MIHIHATRKDKGPLLELTVSNEGSLMNGTFDFTIHILETSEDILQYKVALPHCGYIEPRWIEADRRKKWVTQFDGE